MWAHGWGRPVCQWSSSAPGSRLAGSDPVGKVTVVVGIWAWSVTFWLGGLAGVVSVEGALGSN